MTCLPKTAKAPAYFWPSSRQFLPAKRILQPLNAVPTIVDIYLDPQAVIPGIGAKARGLLAAFGTSDIAFLDVIFGQDKPGGHLPIELPSSIAAVRAQKEDMAHDRKNALFKFGFGLSF